MTDDNDNDTADGSTHRSLDLRSADQEEVDEELDAMLEAYKELEDIDSDEPADQKLRELATQKMTDNDTDNDADADTQTETADAEEPGAPPETESDTPTEELESPPETGETTVTIGEKVDPDEADFGPGSEPDPDAVEAAADEDLKAKRREELAEEGMLPDDEGAEADAEADAGSQPASSTAQRDNEQRYGIDISDDSDAVEHEEGAEPNFDAEDLEESPEVAEPSVTEEEAVADMEAAQEADFEDVLEEGLFEDVDDIDADEFDFESQAVEDASDRKEDKVIDMKGVYILLSQPEGDRFYNMLDRAQTAQTIEDRHDLLIEYVVERPYNMAERVEEWSGAARAQLATECAIHSGLSEMQDFQ